MTDDTERWSVRLPEELAMDVDAYRADRGLSRSGAVQELARRGVTIDDEASVTTAETGSTESGAAAERPSAEPTVPGIPFAYAGTGRPDRVLLYGALLYVVGSAAYLLFALLERLGISYFGAPPAGGLLPAAAVTAVGAILVAAALVGRVIQRARRTARTTDDAPGTD